MLAAAAEVGIAGSPQKPAVHPIRLIAQQDLVTAMVICPSPILLHYTKG